MPLKNPIERAAYNKAYRQRNKETVTAWESHYKREIRSGQRLLGERKTIIDPALRFWPRVDKTHQEIAYGVTTGCWLWQGPTNHGHGVFNLWPRHVQAHRWAWEQENGTIPEGMVLDHLCRTKACVRTSHLDAVTQGENLRRASNNPYAWYAIPNVSCHSRLTNYTKVDKL